jgi:hypothetical protein
MSGINDAVPKREAKSMFDHIVQFGIWIAAVIGFVSILQGADS